MANNKVDDWEDVPLEQADDWEDVPLESAPAAKPKTGSAPEAALQGFGNAASFGYLPHLQAAAAPALEKVYELATGNEIDDDSTYLERRDQNLDRQDKLAKESPKSFTFGNLAGSIMGTGSLAAGAKGAGLAAKFGPGLIGKMRAGAAAGGALGAVANPGDVEGESGLQVGDRLKSAIVNAGIGGAIPLAMKPAEVGFDKLSKYLKGKAEENAFSALGPYSREVKQTIGRDNVRSMGRDLLDEGVIGARPVAYETLENRASALKGKFGDQLDDYIDSLDDAKGATVSRQKIIDEAREELINPNIEIPGVADKNVKAEAMLNTFNLKDKPNLNLRESENLKRAINREIKYDRLPGADIPFEEQVNRVLARKLKEGSEGIAEQLDEAAGSTTFKDLKRKFGNMETAENIASKRNAHQIANRFLSPSDYYASGTGAVVGAATGDDLESSLKRGMIGAGLGFVNKGFRQYGSQVNAKVLDSTAKSLMQMPAFANLAANNPAAFARAVEEFSTNPKFTRKNNQNGQQIVPEEVARQQFIEDN